MALFFQILKIIGIILLCILALLIVVLLLVLFVPIRYRIKGERKVPDEAPVRAQVKITWFLHLLTAAFTYPEEAYIKVKVLGIRVYSTEEAKSKEKSKEQTKEEIVGKTTDKTEKKAAEERQKNGKEEPDQTKKEVVNALVKESENASTNETANNKNDSEKIEENYSETEEKPAIIKFFLKLWQILKNIKYTIQKIYDKIREVIKNIRYYIAVIQSETFQRAFDLCKEEVFGLLKSILPGKLTGNFVIGTGDPASTAQILAVHGILYPLLGNHITITPDFENTIVEGDFFIKGKITVFKVLKTAIKVYFNRDIKRVIRLLKREAKVNGRK